MWGNGGGGKTLGSWGNQEGEGAGRAGRGSPSGGEIPCTVRNAGQGEEAVKRIRLSGFEAVAVGFGTLGGLNDLEDKRQVLAAQRTFEKARRQEYVGR